MFNQIKIIEKHFDKIPTTQDKIKEFKAQISNKQWVLCTANEQTKGRGTRSRMWLSPPDVNIYATYGFLLPNYCIAYSAYIPQITALSVAQSLQDLNIKDISLKWVNDVLVNNAKICGILSEAEPGNNHLIIYLGVGINVNMEAKLCNSLDQPVTSMKVATGKIFKKKIVLSVLNHHLARNIQLLINKGFSAFYQPINNLLAFRSENITFDTEDKNYQPKIFQAKLIGINQQGYLLLKPHTKITKHNNSSELEIKPNQQLTFMTGRILRGQEILYNNKYNQLNSIYQKYKWPLLGITVATATGLTLWYHQKNKNLNTDSNSKHNNTLDHTKPLP